jgi:hypothetical protein
MTHETNEAITLPVSSFKEGNATSWDGAVNLSMNIKQSAAFKAWGSVKEGGEAEFFATQMQLGSKEAYLEFRDNLKALINAMAAGQKVFSHAMHQFGGSPDGQWRKNSASDVITRLIEIRRAGKVWSASEAVAKRDQLAA